MPVDNSKTVGQSSAYVLNDKTSYCWFSDISLEKELIQGKSLNAFPSSCTMMIGFNGIANKAIVVENNKISIKESKLKLKINEEETKNLLLGKLVQKCNFKDAFF